MSTNPDAAELQELAYRYAACTDERDAEGAAALFTDDGVLAVPDPPTDLRPVHVHRGRAEVVRAFAPLAALRLTFHAVAGVVVDPGDTPGTARGRVSCVAHHVEDRGDALHDHVWYLHYRDAYRRTDAGWRISRREVHIDLLDSRRLPGAPPAGAALEH